MDSYLMLFAFVLAEQIGEEHEVAVHRPMLYGGGRLAPWPV